jgi:hypothetical protein
MYKLLLISIIGLASCASSTVVTEKPDAIDIEGSYNVHITITEPVPYCGGAAPTEEMLNRTNPVSGNFVLVHVETGEKTIVTSESGILRLQLNVGNYILKETFKDVSFEQFMNDIPQSGRSIKPGTEDCYKKWWSTNLSEFEILPDSPRLYLQCSLYRACYTGNNPCDIYTGPYPPSAPPRDN